MKILKDNKENEVPIIPWEMIKDWHLNPQKHDYYLSNHKIKYILSPYLKSPKQFASILNANKNQSMISRDTLGVVFQEKDILIIDPTISLKNGAFIIVLQKDNQNEPILLHYILYGGKFFLKPINSQYSMFEFHDDIEVCGTVIANTKTFIDLSS